MTSRPAFTGMSAPDGQLGKLNPIRAAQGAGRLMSGTGSEGILKVLRSPISQEVPMFRLLGAIRQNPFSLCRTRRRFAERILLNESALVQSSLQFKQRPSAALVQRIGLFRLRRARLATKPKRFCKQGYSRAASCCASVSAPH